MARAPSIFTACPSLTGAGMRALVGRRTCLGMTSAARRRTLRRAPRPVFFAGMVGRCGALAFGRDAPSIGRTAAPKVRRGESLDDRGDQESAANWRPPCRWSLAGHGGARSRRSPAGARRSPLGSEVGGRRNADTPQDKAPTRASTARTSEPLVTISATRAISPYRGRSSTKGGTPLRTST